MPFKSKAQRRKFAQLLVEGKITPEVYEEWNRETGGQHLPERVDKRTKAPRRKPTTRRKKKAPARRTARPRTRARKSKRKSSRKRSRRT
jgi:hypothetical protein